MAKEVNLHLPHMRFLFDTTIAQSAHYTPRHHLLRPSQQSTTHMTKRATRIKQLNTDLVGGSGDGYQMARGRSQRTQYNLLLLHETRARQNKRDRGKNQREERVKHRRQPRQMAGWSCRRARDLRAPSRASPSDRCKLGSWARREVEIAFQCADAPMLAGCIFFVHYSFVGLLVACFLFVHGVYFFARSV